MCEYCEKEKRIEELHTDNIYLEIYGKHLRLNGKVMGIRFGRDFMTNYCPMCGRKLEYTKEVVMSKLEQRYKKINDIYGTFSYAVIAYDANKDRKPALLAELRKLQKELELLECDLLK